MKDFLAFLSIVAAVVGLWFVTPAWADSAIIYDGEGNLAGTVIGNGRTDFVYDGQGSPAGTIIQNGNNAIIYGRDGGLAGQIIDTSPRPHGLGCGVDGALMC